MNNTALRIPEKTRERLEKLLYPSSIGHVEPLTKGGSDRSFYRIAGEEGSYILSLTENREELRYYISFGTFFHSKGIPVPRFYFSSLEEGAVIMEDAGRLSLCDRVHHSKSREEIKNLYINVLKELFTLQRLDPLQIPPLQERPFGYDTLRWETSYFSEQCLGTLLGMNPAGDAMMEEEFHRLASLAAQLPHYPMHRDFQSQNIYLKEGRPYFLDFQGARTGPFLYDAASLLGDPYVNLPRDLQEDLLENYFQFLRTASFITCDYGSFRREYTLLSLQRLMQALGAYGFLGIRKGKKDFLAYVAPAFAQLQRSLSATEEFPRIAAVVRKAASIHW